MVGISHKSAPVELRERLSFPSEDEQSCALQELFALEGVSELVLLTTCNRTEIYVEAELGVNIVGELNKYLAARQNLGPCALIGYSYSYSGIDLVRHLFSVVCSLDSMVLGEAQILGQVRRAYQRSEELGYTHTHFNHLFRQALELGKKVRSQTGIGAHSISVSTLALQLANKVFESLSQRRLIIIGAGEMAELTASYFAECSDPHIVVANRNKEHAQELARRFGGRAIALDELDVELEQADIVISSTASPQYVLDAERLKAVKLKSRGRSLLMIDLAVPRDIDPEAARIEDVFLFDIDDLSSLAEEGYEARRQQAELAQGFIEKEVAQYKIYLQEQKVMPTIADMRKKAELIRDRELERASKYLKNLSEEERLAVEAMANSIITKMLHGPFARLRKNAQDPEAYLYAEAARYLFGLDSYPEANLPDEKRKLMLRARFTREQGEKRE